MSDLQKLAIKLFAEPGTSPALPEFIPVFHRWIQTGPVEDLLIDVADYSHVEAGPGILLVAHEGNYAVDMAGGRMGLLYSRKQPFEGSLVERLTAVTRAALRACRLLEEAPELEGRIRFRGDEMLIVANDRLRAPNTDETLAELRGALGEFFARVYGGMAVSLEREADPKERFSVTARVGHESGIEPLLRRLSE
ncbi:MAG: hypothetical protein ACREQY_02270 [Candidatus Binatia bacterium]